MKTIFHVCLETFPLINTYHDGSQLDGANASAGGLDFGDAGTIW